MAGLRPVAAALLLALLPACTGLLGTDAAEESAHAVFMARPNCPYIVTSETQRGFAVLTPQDDFVPQPGDLLLGNFRTGALTIDVIPFGSQTTMRTVPFDIVGHSLSLAEAQAFYYGYCPLPPPVPVTAPADSTDTF
jgi:hypothetical protein